MSMGARQIELNIPLSERQQSGTVAFVSEHVAGVAHEMRNLLAIIQLQARMLPKNEPDSPQFRDSLAIVQGQAKRMALLVDNLLAFGDLREPQFETTDVNALVRYTVGLQADLCLADGLQVVVELDEDLPPTQADPFQLEQIFVNLVNNAREALKNSDQPGMLTVSTVRTKSESGAPKIEIRFADNGPGIPPEVMARLFEPFFTTKRRGEGIGLGLVLSDRIAKAHLGRLWVEDAPEGGAAFVLELPVARSAQFEEPETARPQVGLESQPSSTIAPAPISPSLAEESHILVVDDEPAVALAVKGILSKAGFRVTVAESGKEALSALAQDWFDLVVSDLRMPEMDGPRFYELATHQHPHLSQRIIFSTADSGGRQINTFLQNSGCARIGKPFQADELLDLVNKTLQNGEDPTLESVPEGQPWPVKFC
jgi:two-component system NtrC family sensor kinase